MVRYRIVSDSMTPLIPIGAEVLLKDYVEGMELKRFDILVFKQKDRFICHYFWHKNRLYDQGLIVTRCLKMGSKDRPFETKEIVGIVTNYKINFFQKFKILLLDYLP